MLKIPQKIEKAINILYENGFEAYIVGGCVRDMLMGITPHDFDITTNALPEQIQALFEKTVPTGIKHGTVTVIIDKTPIEITTYRSEGNYTDHRHPENIKFVSTLKEDLSRRDFTVNAMAYNSKFGLIDFFGGQNDLKNGILRAVGNPEIRFEEDALRILRLFRFASVLGLDIEKNTLHAAIKKVYLLKNISGERIFSELYRAINGKNINIFAHLLNSNGLNFLKAKNLPDFNVIKQLNTAPDLAFFAFLYLSECDFSSALKYLKVSNKLSDYCYSLLELTKTPLPDNKAQIKRALCKVSPEIFSDFLQLKSALGTDVSVIKIQLNEILKTDEPYLISHLKIDGNILKEMGICGTKTGEVLRHLQSIVIEDKSLNTKEKLKFEIQKFLP